MPRTVARQCLVVVAGLFLVASLAGTGFSDGGVVAGQAANGTNASNASGPGTGRQLGRLKQPGGPGANGSAANGSATNGSNQSGPLNASEQRNKTGAGNVGKGLTVGGNVSKSIQGNTTPAGSGGGGGGLFGFSMTDDVISPTLNSTQTLLADGTTWVLNESLETTVGTPVPEDDNDDGIVFVPTNDPWKGLYHDYYVPYIFPLATVLALLGMIIECGIMPWRALRNPTYSQTRAFVAFVLTLVAIIFTVPIITVMHSFVDVLATNVAPSPDELTQSAKGLTNLGAGAAAGIIAAYGLGFAEVLMLAFIYALRYGALFILPWFLPLLIALSYNAPHDRLSGLSSELLWQYVGLLIQAVPVALLFRAALEMGWDVGLGGLMGVLASGAIFLIAAGLPLVTSIGMFKAAPSVQSVATGAAGYVAGSRATDYARQAPGQAARGGYQRMASAKTKISDRIAALRGNRNPDRHQATLDEF